MQKNFNRSSSGLVESRASSITRWLNSNQLNSRLIKREGTRLMGEKEAYHTISPKSCISM